MATTSRRVSWVAQPCATLGCSVDAVYGEFGEFDESADTLHSIAALARSTLLLPSHAQLDVCAFVHRADGSIERAIIATV